MLNRLGAALAGAWLILFSGQARAAAETIVLAGDPYCPVNCEVGSARSGFAVDIAKAVFEAKGFKLAYRILPWSRAVSEGRAGMIDGIIGASPGKPGFLYPAQSIGNEHFMFFGLTASTFQYHGLASLKKQRIGFIQDYEIPGEIGQYLLKNQKNPVLVHTVSGDNAAVLNMEKLIGNRIDLLVESESVGLYLANTLGIAGKVKPVGELLAPTPVYIAFSAAKPESKALVKAFDQGLVKLRKSGELARILAGYGLRDWK